MKTKFTILCILFCTCYIPIYSQTAGPNGTTSYDIKGADVYCGGGAKISVFSSTNGQGGSISLIPAGGCSTSGKINLTGPTAVTGNLTVTGLISGSVFSTSGNISAGSFSTTGTISAGSLSTTGNLAVGCTATSSNLKIQGTTNPLIELVASTGGALQFGIATSNGSYAAFASTGDAVIRK
jgi:hypothetical protein